MHPDPTSTDVAAADPGCAAPRPADHGDARGEAARAADRLEVARARIAAAHGSAGSGSGGAGSGEAAGYDVAWGGRDDVDDEVRTLLSPAVDRISRLAQLAAAMADGRLSDASAAEAARAIADAQPHRRPR